MTDLRIADPAELTGILADAVRKTAADAIADRGLFTLALPGGSVATTCFPALAALAVDWTRTHFWWADERAVPASDPESNYGLADRLWLSPAGVPAASIHRMPADAADLVAAADAYGEELSRALGRVPVLDLALLGMGPDGHVASLFPGHHLLGERDRLAAAITDAPKPPSRRLTLTLPVLQHARSVIVVAFGATKARALHQALEDSSSTLPVAEVLRGAARAIVLADAFAGGELRRPGSAKP